MLFDRIRARKTAAGECGPRDVPREGRARDVSRLLRCLPWHGCRGQRSRRAGLKKHPPDLTQLSRRNGGKFPAQIVSSVIQGNDFITDHGTRDMPMWGDAFRAVNHDDTLAKLKVRSLTASIESIQQK